MGSKTRSLCFNLVLALVSYCCIAELRVLTFSSSSDVAMAVGLHTINVVLNSNIAASQAAVAIILISADM